MVCIIINVYFAEWTAEILVISYGLIHGMGGASVAINLSTVAYIGDIATPETKVNLLLGNGARVTRVMPGNSYFSGNRVILPITRVTG